MILLRKSIVRIFVFAGLSPSESTATESISEQLEALQMLLKNVMLVTTSECEPIGIGWVTHLE